MFKSDRFAQVATAAIGAIVLSTLSITAAIGPVRAADRSNTQLASAAAFADHDGRANG
jgi:hypothetical protein